MSWIPIDTDITSAEWFWDGKTTAMFLHLVRKAILSPKKWSIIISRKKLSDETKLSEREVRTCLTKLEETGWIKLEAATEEWRILLNKHSRATNRVTVLTIEKKGFVKDIATNQATNQDAPNATNQATPTNNDKQRGLQGTDNKGATNQATNQDAPNATNPIYNINNNKNIYSLSTACAYVREEEIREAITEQIFWERLVMLLTPAPFSKTEAEITEYASRFINEKMAKQNDQKWKCTSAGQVQALCTNYIKCEILKEQRINGNNKPHRETDDEFIARAAKLAKSAARDPFEDYDF